MSGSDDSRRRPGEGPWEHLLFTKVAAAALLGVSRGLVDQYLADGILHAQMAGRRLKVTRASLAATYRDRFLADPPAPYDPGWDALDPGPPRRAAPVARTRAPQRRAAFTTTEAH